MLRMSASGKRLLQSAYDVIVPIVKKGYGTVVVTIL
jgi:hypothetical protein